MWPENATQECDRAGVNPPMTPAQSALLFRARLPAFQLAVM